MKLTARLLHLALALGAGLAQAQPVDLNEGDPAHIAQERTRIAAERKQVDVVYNQGEAACYQKFTLNDCMDKVRAQRRKSLADLQRQEVALNDAQRRRKGAEQMQRAEQKASALNQQQAADRRAKAREELAGKQQKSAEKATRAETARQDQASHQTQFNQKSAASASPATKASTAAQESKRHTVKLQEAAEHQAAHDKKLKEKTKPPAQPLPTPAP
jgi:hypothetical protein